MKYWMPIAALSAAACGSDSSNCRDTYYTNGDGSNGSETTCEQGADASPPSSAATRDLNGSQLARGCTEQFATLYENGVVREVYRRRCDDPALSISDDNLEGVDIGQLAQGIILDDCFLADNVHTISVLGRPLVFPFTTARERFNEIFADDGLLPNVVLSENSVRPAQAGNDITRHELRDTPHPDFPNATGVTDCARSDSGARVQCLITIHTETIAAFSATLGFDPNEISLNTALHEYGHTVCLNHLSINSPAAVTAMNSFFLTDTVRPQSDYFTLLRSERDEVRSLVQD
jgi:hypothetical protein